jgi:hypothetical protein
MSLNVQALLSLEGAHTRGIDLGEARFPIGIVKNFNLTDGVGAGQIDRMFSDRRTLAASGTEDLDLAGALTDSFGLAVTFARIKLIYVAALAANVNDVNVTRAAANGVPLFLAAGDGLPIKPGGAFMWVAPNATGVPVTAATADLLTFTNAAGGAPVTYDVIILGASA